jgi:Tol biopolymer transport system component
MRRLSATIALAAALASACGDSGTSPDDTDVSSIAFAYAGDSTGKLDLWVMSPDGSEYHRIVTSPETEALPDWSPDGQTLLFTRRSAGTSAVSSLWTVRADGSELHEISAGMGDSFGGRWSPDGLWVVFRTGDYGASNIVVMRADGAGRHTVGAPEVDDAYSVPTWSVDGRIAFKRTSPATIGIWMMKPDGSELTRMTRGDDSEPRWSPDGTRLVFSRQTVLGSSVENALIVMDPNGSLRQITGASIDRAPTWSPDGQFIIFDRQVPFGNRSACPMFRVLAAGGVAVNIQPARTRQACQGSAWRSRAGTAK